LVAVPVASSPAPEIPEPKAPEYISTAAPRGPALVAANATAADESRVAEVLRRYARAYGELNASAAREVWPTVNERALSRAFESLSSQSLSFDNCQINVRGAIADASCRGEASYVGKVGSGEARTEPRSWRFELRRDGENWKIQSAEARRLTTSSH
jgi:hypothetical protein